MREQKISASGSIVSVEQTEQERGAVDNNIYPLNHHNSCVLSKLADTTQKSILKSVSPLALTSLAVLGVMTAPGYTQSCSSSTNSSTKVKTFNCSTSFTTATSAISVVDGTNAIVMNIASGVTMSSTSPSTPAMSIRTSGDGVTVTQASGGGTISAGRILFIRTGQQNLTASVSVTLTGELNSSVFNSTAIFIRNYEYDTYNYLPGKVELTINNLSARGYGVFLGGGGDISITANSITADKRPIKIESQGTDSSNITVNVSSISLTGSNFQSDNRNNGVHIEVEKGGNITISATTIAGGQYPIWIDHKKGSGTISISADNIEASSTIQNNQSHGSYGVRISRSASSSGPTTITSQGVQRRAKTAIDFAHAGSGAVKIYGFTVSASQQGFNIRTKDAVTISGASSTKPLSINVTSSTGGEAIKVSRLPPSSVGNISVTVGTATSPRSNIDVRNSGAGSISITATGNLVTRSTASSTAVIAVNSSSSAGSVSISANNINSKQLGIYVFNRGSGGTTITGSGTISSQNHGIQVKDYNSGDVKVTLTSSTSVKIDNSRATGRTGLYITKSGTGDVEISAGSISSLLEGIIAGTSSGDLKITLSGDVTAGTLTSLNDIAGIKAISYGGSSTIVLNSGTTVSAGGNNGRGIYAKGSGEIKIQAATVKGTGSGIYVSTTGAVTIEPSTSTTLLKVSATASNGNNAIYVKRGIGATGNVSISAYDAVSNKSPIYVSNSGAGNITITSSGLLQASGSFNSVQVRKTRNLSGDISVTVKNIRSVGNRGINISNRGTGGTTVRLNGTLTASSYGISIYDTTSGDISVTLASGASISTSSGTNSRRGIYARKGGGITADGKVTITTAGPITAATDGIYVAPGINDSAYITVNGNITAGTTTLSTVTNNTAIKARTSSGGFADITVNGGVITSSGTAARSIDHTRGTTRVRFNGGTIASPVDIGSEIDLFIMNSGNLNANVSLGSGDDAFTFNGGTISSGVTIDGGAGTNDALIINSSGTFNFSGVSNFESLTLGSPTQFSSSTALFNFASITANGTISFSNNEPGSNVGFTTNLSGTGLLIIDAKFTGSDATSDFIDITGNISGSLKVRINDLSTSGESRTEGPFNVLRVSGTASSGALRLENNSIISGNFSYTIEYHSATKTFRLVGLRSTLRCAEGGTQGIFTCTGAVVETESMIKSGATNIVTTLDGTATVNVSSDVAFRLTGANGISFSQGSSGNNLTLSGSATGFVHALTSGTGAVSISLTGSALSNGNAANASGLYVKASTGNVTISSSGAITMTSTGGIAHGVRAIATTGDVSVNVSGKVTVEPYDRAYGIHVSATTGDVTISSPGGVHAEGSSRNSVGIFAKTTTGDISITTSGEVRTSNSGQNIVALTAGGDIEISTGVIVQGRYSISASNSSSSTGDIDITTVGDITATNVVFYVNNRGNNGITINASGDLEATSAYSVVYANHYGNGTISVTTSGDITGGKYAAIYVEGQGTLTVNVNDGNVTSLTGSTENAGVFVKNYSSATGSMTINIASGVNVIGGGKGIYAKDFGSSQNISITSTGTISGILSHGIRVYQKNSGNVTISTNTVTSSAGKGIDVAVPRNGNSSGTVSVSILLGSGASITSKEAGIHVLGSGGSGINASISTFGTVTSNSGDAIYVGHSSSGGGTVSINAVAALTAGTVSGNSITGGRHGIYVRAQGSRGDKTITTAGTISATQHGIYVKSSQGGGNISISATGAITASGRYGIVIDPRGPGTISISTSSITAGNFGIYMDSGYDRGTSGNITVSVTGDITITGADSNFGSAAVSIDMEGDHKGDINVNITGDISSTGSGMRIGHYGAYSSGDVNVNMSGDMTASRDGIVAFASGNHVISVTFTGTMSVAGDAIELYLDDGYSGDLTIVAHGSFTSSGSRGTTALSAYNEASGNTSITVSGTVKSAQDYGVFQKSFSGDVTFISHSGSVIEGKKVGVWIANKGANVSYSGPTTVTASGSIKGGLNNTSAVNGLEIQHYGTDLILSAEDVQGTKHGIEAVHGKDGSNRTGSFSVTIVGDVVATGASAEYGIFLRSFSTAPTVSLTVNSGASVTGVAGGIKIETKASSGNTITTSGAISGTRNGIIAINSSGNNSLTIAGDVTATASGAKGLSLFTNNGTSTVIINSGTINAEVAISDDETNTSVTVNSGATISGQVRLSGGVDILTFEAGSSFDRTKILDGGEDAGSDTSIDVLTLNTAGGVFETTKWINWERIVLGAGQTFTTSGTTTIEAGELSVAGTLSLASTEAGDSLTIAGNFTGNGTVNLDIDFLTGTADTITIQGNATDVKTVTITDVSSSGVLLDTSIDVITVEGTVAAGAFSIGNSQFVSGSYRYTLVFNASTKTFTLSGDARNVRCTPSSVGVYGCSGAIAVSEYFFTRGNVSIVANLSANTTSEVTTGRAINIQNQAGITVTQAANGGELKAMGSSTGVIYASSTGDGNVSISLTGTASLEGNGYAIQARSTNNGNVVIRSTAKVSATHPAATAIYATGQGSRIEIDVNEIDAGSQGVVAKNITGATTILTRGAVTTSGTSIYAYSKVSTVTVNTSGAVTATRSGVVAKNTGTSGSVSVRTNGTVTANNVAVYAMSKEGSVVVNAVALSGNGSGVVAKNTGTKGTVTVATTGDVTTSGTAVYASSKEGTVNVTVSAVTGNASGIVVKNDGTSGSVSVTATHSVTSNGTGIYAMSKEGRVTVNARTVSGNQIGIDAKNTGDAGSVAITSTGMITASGTAIRASSVAGTVTVNIVSAAGTTSGLVLMNTGDTGSVTISSTGLVESDGVALYAMSKQGAVSATVANVDGGNASGIVLKNTGTAGSVTLRSTGTVKGSATVLYAMSKEGSVTINVGDVEVIRPSPPPPTTGTGTNTGTNTGTTTTPPPPNPDAHGIIAKSEGTGAVSLTITGTLDATGSGIHAYSKSGAITVNAVAVSAAKDAIVATNSGGTGDVVVTTTGKISSMSGTAIRTRIQGTGGIDINASDEVTTATGTAIYAFVAEGGTTISIDAEDVSGQRNAINAWNNGNGAITINLSGAIQSRTSDALVARHDNSGAINITTAHPVIGGNVGTGINTTTSGATNITLNQGANVRGGSGVAIRNGDGPSTVTVNSGVSLSGAIELGGGADRLTFASNSFGSFKLDGGGGTGDILTINSGSIELQDGQFVNWEEIILSDQTSLVISGLKSIVADSLTVKGTIDLQDGEANDTLDVSGAFVGGGRVTIDVDFAAGLTDRLVIEGAVTERTTISLRDVSRIGGRERSIPVVSVDADSNTNAFALDKIYSSGGVSYTLRYDSSQKAFVLAGIPVTGPMLTALPITLFDAFARAPSMHQRVGGNHLRDSDGTFRKSTWTRVISGERKYGTMGGGLSEFETATLGYQVGYDFAVIENTDGVWIFSVTAQNSTIETDIVTNSETGLFESTGVGVGATATWYRNNGMYLDLQSQFNQITTDLSSANSLNILNEDKASSQFISFEIGQRVEINDDITLVAQFQTSWGRVTSQTVDAPNGLAEFGLEGGGTLRLGAGAEFGKIGETMFEGYIRGNIYHDTMDSWDVNFASRVFSDEIESPTSLELVAGGSLAITDKAMLFMQGTFRNTVGGDFPDGADRPSVGDLSAGFRWSW